MKRLQCGAVESNQSSQLQRGQVWSWAQVTVYVLFCMWIWVDFLGVISFLLPPLRCECVYGVFGVLESYPMVYSFCKPSRRDRLWIHHEPYQNKWMNKFIEWIKDCISNKLASFPHKGIVMLKKMYYNIVLYSTLFKHAFQSSFWHTEKNKPFMPTEITVSWLPW